MPNFKKFGAIFVIFVIFKVKNKFFQQVVALRFCWGHPFAKKVYIFGINMKKYACLEMVENFGQVLGLQKGKKHPKSALSATFLPHRKQSWENQFLERQMDSKFRNSSCSRK